MSVPEDASKPQALERTVQALSNTLHVRETISLQSYDETLLQELHSPASPEELNATIASLTNVCPRLSSDYIPQALLGQGGMGQIRAAHQQSLGRQVAVKQVSSHDTLAIFSLIHEGRLMGQLEHPNVVPIHALVLDEQDRPSLVMKRIDGTTWSSLLEQEHHPMWAKLGADTDHLEFHLRVCIQLCNVLHFAHSTGILHLDIKPDNVMIGAFGELYLLDWGVSLRTENGVITSHSLVGTPSYMAPEMVLRKALDVRTDVFLLGGALYHVLTGRPPHEGQTVLAVFTHAGCPHDYMFSERVPSELKTICEKALAFEPEKRFASAMELRYALERHLSHRSSIRLTDSAHTHMKALFLAIESKQQLEARKVFSECQFAYSMALREWPSNPEAEAQLFELRSKMCQFEIDCANVGNAEALLALLAPAPPVLISNVEALKQRQAKEAEHRAEVEHVAKQFNLSHGVHTRSYLLLGLVLFLALQSAYVSTQLLRGFIITPLMALFQSAMPSFLLGLLGLAHKKIKPEPLTKKLYLIIVFALFAINLHRVWGLFEHTDAQRTFRLDFLILGVMLGTTAVLVHKRLWLAAALEVCGYGLAFLFPRHSIHLFNGIQPLMVLYIVWQSRVLTQRKTWLIE